MTVGARSARVVRHVGGLLALLLAGCGGGGGTGGTSLLPGGSQDPDPVVVDFALAYVARPIRSTGGDNLLASDPRDPARFRPGADLRIRDRASPSAAERSITEEIFPAADDGTPAAYDVRDLSVSWDGTQLLFALRAPQLPDTPPELQPTWDIWLYDHGTGEAHPIIDSEIVARAGQDLAPRFLPDGRILFASTRQREARAILLDEGKPQFVADDEDRALPAFSLHVMEPDGSDIRQITFSPSGDLHPTVLGDGHIAFSRRDNVSNIDRISLYSVRPDGSGLQALYGIHSHDTGPDGSAVEFVEPQELPDGRLLVLLRQSSESARNGALPVAVDTASFIDNDEPTYAAGGLTGPAQEPLFTGELELADTEPSLQGRFAAVTPLHDGSRRYVVAWSQCRLEDTESTSPPQYLPCSLGDPEDPRYVEAPPLYGIWMRDAAAGTEQPVVVGREGVAYTDIAVLEPRTLPPVVVEDPDASDPDLADAGAGALHIRSVYDFAGTAAVDIEALRDPLVATAADRPARFLRLVKAVSLPDEDLRDVPDTAFGRSSAQLMREVLGYAMIEPDGSVEVRVPANVPFWPEVLDASGQRIGERHQNWLQVRPGEVLTCNGCHTSTSRAPHGRPGAEPPSANAGAPVDGSPFPNTDPALFADEGETMAEVRSRILGVPAPDMDLVFVDLWTDPAVRTPDAAFAARYSSLTTPAPVDPGCTDAWTASCRITIHYPTHIHPLWSVDRSELDTDGTTVLADHTCTSCHAPSDADGLAIVPADQLDLSDGPSAEEAEHLKSYRELLFPDNQQIVEDGVLVDELVQARGPGGELLFQEDADGNLVLDTDGNPIPILVPIGVSPPMSVGGARQSPRFFDLFAPGGSHENYLDAAELKLVTEWIDIGGQYYNDPFAVPE
jgi:hypothetical protein